MSEFNANVSEYGILYGLNNDGSLEVLDSFLKEVVILEEIVLEPFLFLEDLLVFLARFDLPSCEVAHDEAHFHKAEDTLVEDYQHFVLIFVLRLQVSSFELLVFLLP